MVFQRAFLPGEDEEGRRGEPVLRRRRMEAAALAAPALRPGVVAGEGFGLRRRRGGGLLRLLGGGVEADAAEGDAVAEPARRRARAERFRAEVLPEPVSASEPQPAVEPEGDDNAAVDGGVDSRRCKGSGGGAEAVDGGDEQVEEDRRFRAVQLRPSIASRRRHPWLFLQLKYGFTLGGFFF